MIRNDDWLLEQLRNGTIILQDDNPHTPDLIRPNSLDTTVGPTLLVELTDSEMNAIKSGLLDMDDRDKDEDLNSVILSAVLKATKPDHLALLRRVTSTRVNKRGVPFGVINLLEGPVVIPGGVRIVVETNERLRDALRDTAVQAVLRSGAATDGWVSAGGFGESGFSFDPEGEYVQHEGCPWFKEWISRPEFGGVVYTHALFNASRRSKTVAYQDRLVQLVFSKAEFPLRPYQQRESSSNAAQTSVLGRTQ